MGLQAVYESQDAVPEALREHYAERNGKFELSVSLPGLSDAKSFTDFSNLNSALKKEREEHKGTKAKLGVWGDLKHDDVLSKLDAIPALEAAAKGNLPEEKINELVEKKTGAKIAPLQRELDALKKQGAEKDVLITGFQQRERTRTIHDSLRKVMVDSKVIDTAQEDVLMLAERVFEVQEDGTVVTKDNVGVTPGLTPKDWLADMQAKRPHWWPASQGGGAGGSGTKNLSLGDINGGKNPWGAEAWNVTAQHQAVKKLGVEKAQKLASEAGSAIGNPFPPVKK